MLGRTGAAGRSHLWRDQVSIHKEGRAAQPCCGVVMAMGVPLKAALWEMVATLMCEAVTLKPVRVVPCN